MSKRSLLSFRDWIERLMTGGTADKYTAILEPLLADARELSCIDKQYETKDKWQQNARQYTPSEQHSKETNKVLIHYLAYLLEQRPATEEAELLIAPTISDFEFWLQTKGGLSLQLIRKQSTLYEELDKQGLQLFNCSTLSEVQEIQNMVLYSDSADKNTIRFIIRFSAFAVTLATGAHLSDKGDVLNKEKAYETWGVKRGFIKNTVRLQSEFIQRIDEYLAEEYGYALVNTPEKRLEQMLHLYADPKAHAVHFRAQGQRSYIDTYCTYLMEQIPDITPVVQGISSPQHREHLPALLMGDARKVVEAYKAWLQQNNVCSTSSLRTFASSLYTCNDIAEEEFGLSLFSAGNTEVAALIKLRIILSHLYRPEHGRSMWCYLNFLAEHDLYDKQRQRETEERIRTILTEESDGRITPHHIPTLYSSWEQRFGHRLNYSEPVLLNCIEQMTISANKNADFILPERLISTQHHLLLKNFIENGFRSGTPAIDYVKIQEHLPKGDIPLTPAMMHRYLELTNDGSYECEKKRIRPAGAAKLEQKDIGEYICRKLREFDRPVSNSELLDAIPYLDKDNLTTCLNRNEMGWNMGIINPKRKKLFHADIIRLNEEEWENIVNEIKLYLKNHDYMTSGALYDCMSSRRLDIFLRYPYLDGPSLYCVLRYKLGHMFTFGLSYITTGKQMDTPGIFCDFCKEHDVFKLQDLLDLSAKLSKSTIPFESIYNISARINKTDFVNRSLLHFDVSATDNELERLCTHRFTQLADLMKKWVQPIVSGFEWTDFLMQHYLCFHSKKFRMLYRNFVKGSHCNGFIVSAQDETADFDEAIAQYLATLQFMPTCDQALNILHGQNLIGARRYDNIEEVLKRTWEIQSSTS